MELTKNQTVELPEDTSPTPEMSEVQLEQLTEAGVLAEDSLYNTDVTWESVQQLEARVQQQIQISGEQQYREMLARQRSVNRLDAIADAANSIDPVDQADVQAIATMILDNTIRNGSLEIGAVDTLANVAMGNPTVAKYIDENGYEPIDMKAELQAKRAMVAMRLEELDIIQKQTGFLGNAGQFLALMIPGVEAWLANQAAGKEVKGFFAAQTMKDAYDKVKVMDPDEFYAYLDEVMKQGWNTFFMEQFISSLVADTDIDAREQAVWEALDVIPGLGTVGKGARGTFNTAEALLTMGARKEAVEVAVESALKDTSLKSSEDAISSILPSIGNPDRVDPLVAGASGEVNRALNINKKLADDLFSGPKGERLDPDSYAVVIQKAEEELARRFEDYQDPVDFLPVTVDTNSRIRTIHGLYDDGNGNAFANKQQAATYARERLGLAKSQYDYYDTEGGILLKISSNVSETKNVTIPQSRYADPYTKPISIWKRWLWGAKQTQDEISRKTAQLSEAAAERLVKTTSKIVDNSLSKLTKKERANLETALAFSHRMNDGAGGWMTNEQLEIFFRNHLGQEITDKDKIAYFSMRQLNDIDWAHRNVYSYAELARRGYFQASVKKSKFWEKGMTVNVTKHSKYLDDMNEAMAFDAERGVFVTLNDYRVNKFIKQDGYVILQPSHPMKPSAFKVEEGQEGWAGVEFILAKADNLKEELLNPIQMPYKAGGHRIYDAPWWIKQARRGSNDRYLKPFVHNAGDNFKQMEEHVSKLENMRQVYLDWEDKLFSDAQADALIKDIFPDYSLEDVHYMVKNGDMAKNEAFVLVRDGETVVGSKQEQGARSFQRDGDLNTYLEYIDNTGKMYYGTRGKHVPDVTGKEAPILDPVSAMSQALHNSMNLSAFNNYEIKAIERWVNTYGSDVGGKRVLQDGGPASGTPYERFMKAETNFNTHHQSYGTAKTQRDQILQLLSAKTPRTMEWENRLYNLGEWVARDINPKLGKWVADPKSKDPITALRGLTFDARLGLFAPDQMLLQTQTSWAALSIDPQYGAPAFKDMWLIRGSIINGGENQVVRDFAKKAAQVSGTSPEHFEEIVDIAIKSGFTDIGGSLSLLNDFSVSQGLRRADRSIPQNIREKGRMFFYEGERINKIVGLHMGYSKWRKLNPNAKLYDESGNFVPEALEDIIDLGNTYSINMTRSSAAWWQQGLMSVPTQFLSYQARFLELMLPKMFGGTDQLTATQKMRLFLGQGLFYGSAGLTMTEAMQTQYDQQVGGLLPEGTARKFVQQGIWDTWLLPWVFGEDTDFAKRAGLWGSENLFFEAFDPDSRFWDIAGGPGVDLLSDFGDVFGRIARLGYITNNEAPVGMLSLDVISELMEIPTSTNRILRAKRAYDLQRYITSNETVLTPVTDMQSVMAILSGVPLKSVSDYYSILQESSNPAKQKAEVVKELRYYHAQMAQAIAEGDDERAEALANKIDFVALISIDDPLLRAEAKQEAARFQQEAWARAAEKRYDLEQMKQRVKESKQ